MAERARILIVGGGIAGLSLLLGLRRNGHACELVERAPAWATVGAGIGLSPNGMRIAHALGISEALCERGEILREGRITDASGRLLSRTPLAEIERAFAPTVAIHRAELQDVLVAAVAGVPIRMGATVDAIEPTGSGARVRFSDGCEGDFDVVVGADGLASRVRELALPGSAPRYAGYTTWRMVVPRPQAVEHMTEMWGRGLRFGISPIGPDRVYAFACATEPAGGVDPEIDRLGHFRRRFGGFAGDAPAVLAQLTREEELLRTDVFEVRVPRWQRGRVVLIGDAAHAMTPDLGQGASMALEDAFALTRRLAGLESEGAIARVTGALASWEAERRARVSGVQAQSARLARLLRQSNPLLAALRNTAMRLVPERVGVSALARLAEGAPIG